MAKTVAVLGAGSWGTALAQVHARAGCIVHLWDHSRALINCITSTGENDRYHPGVKLSNAITPEADLATALQGVDFITLAVPSHAVPEMIRRTQTFLQKHAVYICAAKGLEPGTLRTLSQMAAELLGKKETLHRYTVLSGPSFAKEVMREAPTAVVLASADSDTARRVQSVVQNQMFRVFLTDDLIGVEISGALKNVIAIATGAADGLGFGLNTRAALLTRALADISRIGQKLGAHPLTFAGLAGIGDLILTCTGDLSRNRQVGLKLAQGKSLRTILREIQQTAEGIRTAKSAYHLAQKLGVETPILREMYLTLYEGKPPKQAVADLLALDPGGERD